MININDIKDSPDEKRLIKILEDAKSKIGIYTDILNSIEILKNKEITIQEKSKLRDYFLDLIEGLPLMGAYVYSKYVIRSRINKYNSNSYELFEFEHQISYKRDKLDEIKLGRFNWSSESMFYGTIPIDSDKNDPFITSSIETCKEILLIENSSSKRHIITNGLFYISKPLYLINLCNSEIHLCHNIDIRNQIKEYKKYIETFSSKEVFILIERFWSLISDISFSNCSGTYNILNIYKDVLFRYYHEFNQMIFGFMYPSNSTEGIGLNVVLRKEAVDDFLKLQKIGILEFNLFDEEWFIRPILEIVDVYDGKIYYPNGFRI